MNPALLPYLEYQQSGDPLLDYCLWPYEPESELSGKQRSINLLLASFDAADLGEEAIALIHAIRDLMGRDRTVWGVKQVDGALSWEFYFYDYERLERRNSIKRLLTGMPERLSSNLNYSEDSPYFMFSIDLTADQFSKGRAKLDEVNIYVGNDGSNVSSGLCYSLTSSGLSLSNLYYFYDTRAEREDIRAKIASSAHLDLRKLRFERILIPELADCQTTVVANKKSNEGIYFSRIKVDQLIWFLEHMGYPASILSYANEARSELNHLLYDVGLDYRMLSDGSIDILKTSYYGIF
ncbi:hypothetical protein [Neptuniibacter caesariensis]|uniref:Uncharacterized protein n=1 Tax=Neptuniibacter caesariensis TaxID=207954 RepID=A0A7U8C2D4_NEPCE|nr:hypothetical protein [Neptuniibacter caesariensis]EAR60228.1 hypothetical protein MED92_17314 [Oceanospirillum sp. MED92] [Neptuniibacter caesariensis]